MYTLNKSYINTKKIKHLQCKNVCKWFSVAYPRKPQSMPISHAKPPSVLPLVFLSSSSHMKTWGKTYICNKSAQVEYAHVSLVIASYLLTY